ADRTAKHTVPTSANVHLCVTHQGVVFFFFKQKTAYGIGQSLEFRRVLFRSVNAPDGTPDIAAPGLRFAPFYAVRSESYATYFKKRLEGGASRRTVSMPN